MPPKYAPLVHYLAAQPSERVTLTLPEMEAIIGSPFPAGARRRDWWHDTTGRTVLRPVVSAAGWQVVLDSFWGRHPAVTFVRDGAGKGPSGRA